MKRLLSIFAIASVLAICGCGKSTETDGGSGSGEITFTNGAEPAPVFNDSSSWTTVGFHASADWTASSDAAWLSVSPSSGASGNISLIVKAQENDTYNERNASVTIRSGNAQQKFTVVQKQKDALLVSSNKVPQPEDGGTFDLELQSNVGSVSCEIENSAAEWLKKIGEVEVRAMETRKLTFEVAANASKDARQGRITLKAGNGMTETVTVYQSAKEARIVLTQSEYSVNYEGETLKIELRSNIEYDYKLPEVDWISEAAAADSRAMSSYTHYVVVAPNYTGEKRSAEILFTSSVEGVEETVTITQLPEPKVEFLFPGEEATDGITRAFPGAEGGGMYVTGGRGGKILHVTTLDDGTAAGTFRHAVNQSGARTIVFDVAGTITLTSDLKISNGNLTIAGQTAPGDGICIKGGTVNIQASNIIIRYMRFRLGDESSFLNDGSDCIWGRYNKDIIIDHCSMSWSVDEVASFYGNQNFTMQWCMVAESMCNSVHGKGGHGYGGIWGGKNASFHHNMLAHNKSRNARIDHPEIYGNYLTSHRGNVDYRNNVIYNWGDNSTYGGEDGHFNVVGNYYKPGPASKDRKYFVDANGFYSSSETQYNYPRLYVEGNVHTKYPEFTEDQTAGVNLHDGKEKGDPENMFLATPLPVKADDTKECFTTTHTAEDAFLRILAYVGASLRRDAVDTHIVNDAETGTATYTTGSNGSTGGIIDSQKDVGGWPVLTATAEELANVNDSDGDGIPDYYEELFGLDPKDASDGAAHDFDSRYSNFEMYLHYLVQETVGAQVEGGVNTSLD